MLLWEGLLQSFRFEGTKLGSHRFLSPSCGLPIIGEALCSCGALVLAMGACPGRASDLKMIHIDTLATHGLLTKADFNIATRDHGDGALMARAEVAVARRLGRGVATGLLLDPADGGAERENGGGDGGDVVQHRGGGERGRGGEALRRGRRGVGGRVGRRLRDFGERVLEDRGRGRGRGRGGEGRGVQRVVHKLLRELRLLQNGVRGEGVERHVDVERRGLQIRGGHPRRGERVVEELEVREEVGVGGEGGGG